MPLRLVRIARESRHARRALSIRFTVPRELVVTAFVLLAVSAGRAHAEEGPYSNFFIGERSLGLAGAFVAVADDSSAVFHNPGGMGALASNSVAGSLWAISVRSRDVESGYITAIGSADLQDSSAPSLPLFAAGVVKVGERDGDGVRPHAISIALLSPRRREFETVSSLQGVPHQGAPSGADHLALRHEDRAHWFGAGYGYRISPEFSLGASVFFAMRRLFYNEVEIRAEEGALSQLGSDAALARNVRLDASGYHGVLRLGALYDLSPHFRLGAMFQPPGLRLGGEGEIDSMTSKVEQEQSRYTAQTADGLTTHVHLPWELRLGVSWLDPPVNLLTLDLSLMGPAGSSDDPRPLVELDEDDPSPGLFVPMVNYRRFAVRGAVGFERVFADRFPVRGGLLMEISSAPPVPSSAEDFRRENIDTFGLSLSAGLRSGGFDLSIGATGLLGFGTVLALRREYDEPSPRYQSTDVSEKTILLFISGGSRAVKKLVKIINREPEKTAVK